MQFGIVPLQPGHLFFFLQVDILCGMASSGEEGNLALPKPAIDRVSSFQPLWYFSLSNFLFLLVGISGWTNLVWHCHSSPGTLLFYRLGLETGYVVLLKLALGE
ncbi:hypothetical protein XENTR_v10016466 [Xenopus tropicalis]|nr:hypothetical protein XENTR_v10016466 [Xenopus tropicalis]